MKPDASELWYEPGDPLVNIQTTTRAWFDSYLPDDNEYAVELRMLMSSVQLRPGELLASWRLSRNGWIREVRKKRVGKVLPEGWRWLNEDDVWMSGDLCFVADKWTDVGQIVQTGELIGRDGMQLLACGARPDVGRVSRLSASGIGSINPASIMVSGISVGAWFGGQQWAQAGAPAPVPAPKPPVVLVPLDTPRKLRL
jgi:hypothetical protein